MYKRKARRGKAKPLTIDSDDEESDKDTEKDKQESADKEKPGGKDKVEKVDKDKDNEPDAEPETESETEPDNDKQPDKDKQLDKDKPQDKDKETEKDGNVVDNLAKQVEVVDLTSAAAGDASKKRFLGVKGKRPTDKRFKFCPHCGNLLQIKFANKGADSWRRRCATCPYIQPIKRRHKYLVYAFKEGEAEDEIVETSKADEHRQKTEILCPNCNANEAFFYQMQTRSADEPMTTFYECCAKTCRHNWRD